MERPSFDELISAYFDDETTPEESVVVERLLADPKHRQALEEYRQLREELRSMPAPKLDAEWSSRLKQRLVTAKPEWAGKADGMAKSVAASAEGGSGAPMPASLESSRGDGYTRFRHLWLTAGVGVAAGTLGIVIGWSAQNLSPEVVAYDTGAPAPMSAASPMATNEAEYGTSASRESQGQMALPAGAQPELAMSEERAEVAGDLRTARDFSTPDLAEQEAIPEGLSGEVSGVENAQRMSRGNFVPELPGAPPSVAGVTDGEADRKQSEKQLEEEGVMPEVRLAIEPPPMRQEGEGLSRFGSFEQDEAARYTTYVGVWDATGDGLTAEQIRGLARMKEDAGDRMRQPADGSRWHATDPSLARETSPALVLEGSPEHVAEALEVLASVRLVDRTDEGTEESYYLRARRLREAESIPQRSIAAAEGQLDRGNADLKDEVSREDRTAAGDAAAEALALRTELSPIDRIEAFFGDEDSETRSSFAEGAPSSGMRADSFGYGEGGGGGFGGGFGGIGGPALPAGSANGPAPEQMPATERFADAPQTDAPQAGALAARGPSPDVAAGAAPPAATPLAAPGPAGATTPARGGASPAAPGAAMRGGPMGAATEGAGVPSSASEPAPAMAGRPMPRAPAPSPASADDATPPPPAEVAAASDAPGAAGAGGVLDKAIRGGEGAASPAPEMSFARGMPAGGAAEADAVPSDELNPTSPLHAGGRESKKAESKLRLEGLQESPELAAPEVEPWADRNFLAPAPRRVRVILYAADQPRPQLPVTGVPADPAGSLLPAAPDAPATVEPAAEAAPAESAPAPDR